MSFGCRQRAPYLWRQHADMDYMYALNTENSIPLYSGTFHTTAHQVNLSTRPSNADIWNCRQCVPSPTSHLQITPSDYLAAGYVKVGGQTSEIQGTFGEVSFLRRANVIIKTQAIHSAAVVETMLATLVHFQWRSEHIVGAQSFVCSSTVSSRHTLMYTYLREPCSTTDLTHLLSGLREASFLNLVATAPLASPFKHRSIATILSLRRAWIRQLLLHIITSLLSGIIELHRHGFTHGDLKPANILLYWKNTASIDKTVTWQQICMMYPPHEQLHVRIADMGTACLISPALYHSNHQFSAHSPFGTPAFNDPPCAGSKVRTQTEASDMWSLGATLLLFVHAADWQQRQPIGGGSTFFNLIDFTSFTSISTPVYMKQVKASICGSTVRVQCIGSGVHHIQAYERFKCWEPHTASLLYRLIHGMLHPDARQRITSTAAWRVITRGADANDIATSRTLPQILISEISAKKMSTLRLWSLSHSVSSDHQSLHHIIERCVFFWSNAHAREPHRHMSPLRALASDHSIDVNVDRTQAIAWVVPALCMVALCIQCTSSVITSKQDVGLLLVGALCVTTGFYIKGDVRSTHLALIRAVDRSSLACVDAHVLRPPSCRDSIPDVAWSMYCRLFLDSDLLTHEGMRSFHRILLILDSRSWRLLCNSWVTEHVNQPTELWSYTHGCFVRAIHEGDRQTDTHQQCNACKPFFERTMTSQSPASLQHVHHCNEWFHRHSIHESDDRHMQEQLTHDNDAEAISDDLERPYSLHRDNTQRNGFNYAA
jgi:serine/threonine protein kinase